MGSHHVIEQSNLHRFLQLDHKNGNPVTQQLTLYTEHQHEVHEIPYHVSRGFEVWFATLPGVSLMGFLTLVDILSAGRFPAPTPVIFICGTHKSN